MASFGVGDRFHSSKESLPGPGSYQQPSAFQDKSLKNVSQKRNQSWAPAKMRTLQEQLIFQENQLTEFSEQIEQLHLSCKLSDLEKEQLRNQNCEYQNSVNQQIEINQKCEAEKEQIQNQFNELQTKMEQIQLKFVKNNLENEKLENEVRDLQLQVQQLPQIKTQNEQLQQQLQLRELSEEKYKLIITENEQLKILVQDSLQQAEKSQKISNQNEAETEYLKEQVNNLRSQVELFQIKINQDQLREQNQQYSGIQQLNNTNFEKLNDQRNVQIETEQLQIQNENNQSQNTVLSQNIQNNINFKQLDDQRNVQIENEQSQIQNENNRPQNTVLNPNIQNQNIQQNSCQFEQEKEQLQDQIRCLELQVKQQQLTCAENQSEIEQLQNRVVYLESQRKQHQTEEDQVGKEEFASQNEVGTKSQENNANMHEMQEMLHLLSGLGSTLDDILKNKCIPIQNIQKDVQNRCNKLQDIVCTERNQDRFDKRSSIGNYKGKSGNVKRNLKVDVGCCEIQTLEMSKLSDINQLPLNSKKNFVQCHLKLKHELEEMRHQCTLLLREKMMLERQICQQS
eukprot:TRINITY_DN4400_c0_g1_i5.p2 TRINITY_DN4400_c0_g1~~TRINITY_DN4400_c0_g1_i5.p2  ORF type:complete len:588 (-),score=77.56 TRINITY_DN4400_c0_g1_i5:71-1774(-)